MQESNIKDQQLRKFCTRFKSFQGRNSYNKKKILKSDDDKEFVYYFGDP